MYLLKNGFEFYYIRPFLEFLEKIGIRGRQLLTDVRWHHHARSRPFVAIRYLRSCTNLRTLEVFARVRVKERPGFWYGVPLLDPRRFFLSSYKTISFGAAKPFGKGAEGEQEIPELRSRSLSCGGYYDETSLRTLSESLKRVKWEISGVYKR